MNSNKLIKSIAKILDIESKYLTFETKPTDIIEWDSLENMCIFVMIDEEFDKEISFEKYCECSTIKDLVYLLELN